MNPITSMADFHFRIKKNERYKQLAIAAYRNSRSGYYSSGSNICNFETAMQWIEDWISKYHVNNYKEGDITTCQDMIDYINRIADRTFFKEDEPNATNVNS